MESVKAECEDCRGTGLYQGLCEKPDEAVVCILCQGSGCRTIFYRPFVLRKGRRGVKTVKRSQGSFLATGAGGVGDAISYAEFERGKMP